MRLAPVAALTLVAGLLGSPSLAAQASVGAAPTTATSSLQGANALRLIATKQVSARLRDLTFTTPALATPTTVRVMLPEHYDPSGATRYPVMYLLHGGSGQYTAWTTAGQAVALTRGLPLITVMPDAGRSAWYTDWYNNGAGGYPKWETYHVSELLPWVDQHFPTFGARSGRAIVGLSSGGFGAMSYASRHPDLFVAAAAFSGALDTNTPPVVGGLVIGGLAYQDGGNPGSLFGLRATEEVRWRGHNPWDLAVNLRDTAVAARAGNGMAGGTYGGGGPTDPLGTALESATHLESSSFHTRLQALGIQHVWEDYGPGTHSYPYWNRDLQKTLPLLMRVFAEHRPNPTSFHYSSIETPFSDYGWAVTMHRSATEFATLDVVGSNGLTVTGSGTADLTTGPVFVPAAAYETSIRDEAGSRVIKLIADRSGRLRLTVDLGPANPVQQQFAETGLSPATLVRTATVAFTR